MQVNEADIYDISEIPYFAYEPSLLVFAAALLLMTFLAVLIVVLRKRYGAKPHLAGLYLQLQNELKSLQSKPLDKVQLAFISLLLRRYVSIAEHQDYLNLSPMELKARAEGQQDARKKKVLLLLYELEQFRFSPIQSFEKGLLQQAQEVFADYSSELSAP